MATESGGGQRKVWVTLALIVLVVILLISTYRTSGSVLLTALAGAWCLLFIIVPSAILNRLYAGGAIRAPGKRIIILTYVVLAVYMLLLAVFEISSGAGFSSWGFTLLATAGFLGAALAARREFE